MDSKAGRGEDRRGPAARRGILLGSRRDAAPCVAEIRQCRRHSIPRRKTAAQALDDLCVSPNPEMCAFFVRTLFQHRTARIKLAAPLLGGPGQEEFALNQILLEKPDDERMQARDVFGIAGAHDNATWILGFKPGPALGLSLCIAHEIDLVEDPQAGNFMCFDFRQHGIGHFPLPFETGI